jgi:hypothetical protein
MILQSYETTGNDEMVCLISDMEPWPYKRKNGEEAFGSADPAVFDEEWTGAWNEFIGYDKGGTSRQIRKVANTVIEYYTNQVGHNLGDAYSAISEGLGIKTFRTTSAEQHTIVA